MKSAAELMPAIHVVVCNFKRYHQYSFFLIENRCISVFSDNEMKKVFDSLLY